MPEPTAYDVAVHHPTVHPADTTVADVRTFLTGEHVHLALVVDAGGVLLTTLDRDDLAGAADDAPARTLGTLAGRTVPADLPEPDLLARVARATARRLAVVDDAGRLLGLVCRKRSDRGWCTDEGVRERRAER